METLKAELETKSVDLLRWVEQTAKQTGDFAAEQAPLFIRELLVYNFWYSMLLWLAGLSMICWVAYVVWGLIWGNWSRIIHGLPPYDSSSTKENNRYFVIFITKTVGGLIGLLAGLPLFFSNLDWLKIWLAPRVYLLEYVRELLK